ncbi:hypothetical protein [Bradyrhizobium sp. AUGA SZCCT0160]|uniref:hypothetical protein n=1 Tax=Bradyrhizobium sp. AUGA SZCCT0160 TaxID=2807662 RepID=UPI001BA9E62F|nr:hypothetical protein [Bradyrhizobium sp. AUGA SZCCT0160]MBR1190385.1 hypothetical protein [Bradyrhizobium sp. AUGA SZCCT0160]
MPDAAIPFHLLRPLWLLALVPVAAIFAMHQFLIQNIVEVLGGGTIPDLIA